MLTTRVVPTSGTRLRRRGGRATHPALAKQVSGIVSQQNTLDRQLTVWENLYFHGRLFGISAKESRRARRRVARTVPVGQVGQGVGLRALRGHGSAADGGAGDLPSTGRAIPGRADRWTRSTEPAGVVGHPRRTERAGQTILLTTHYMEEAESSVIGWRSWTMAGSWRWTRRPNLKTEHRRRHRSHRQRRPATPSNSASYSSARMTGCRRAPELSTTVVKLQMQGGDRGCRKS